MLPEAGLAAAGALGPIALRPLELLTAQTLELPALRPLELLAALALRPGERLGPRPGLFEALAEVFEGLLAFLGTEVGHPLPDSLHHLAALFGRHRGQVLAEHLAEFGLRALRLALAGALAGALALSLAPVALGAVAAHGRGGVGLLIGLGGARSGWRSRWGWASAVAARPEMASTKRSVVVYRTVVLLPLVVRVPLTPSTTTVAGVDCGSRSGEPRRRPVTARAMGHEASRTGLSLWCDRWGW